VGQANPVRAATSPTQNFLTAGHHAGIHDGSTPKIANLDLQHPAQPAPVWSVESELCEPDLNRRPPR
jgi:hypothetical protein